jgi:nucleotide-binding universal stress UspA family protein
MYNNVMVPLDGSQFSECSLDHAKAIASGCNVPEVVLLRVVEPISDSDVFLTGIRGEVVTQVESSRDAEAKEYIFKMVEKLKEEGISAKGDTVYGNAAEEILDYAEKNNIDLVIISTHGRSGISRFAFGSVADRVVRHSMVPVLLVTPSGCRIKQD